MPGFKLQQEQMAVNFCMSIHIFKCILQYFLFINGLYVHLLEQIQMYCLKATYRITNITLRTGINEFCLCMYPERYNKTQWAHG